MAKPAARKKTPPARRKDLSRLVGAKKKSQPAASKTRGSKKCSACGFDIGHADGCANSRCVECKLMAGSHTPTCPYHPSKKALLDGKTGGVLETDVDGKPAKVKVTKAAKAKDVEPKKKGITRFEPFDLENPGSAIHKLQTGIDRKVIFGFKQPKKVSVFCEAEWFDQKTQQSVGCTNDAAFDFEASKTCPTCKTTTNKASDKYCLTHMAMRVMGQLPERQTDIFDEHEHDGSGE